MLGEFLSDSVTKSTRQSFVSHETRGKLSDGVMLRLNILKILSLTAFLVLLANLIQTQMFAGAYYRGLAQGNRIKYLPIHAPRGIIFDRNEEPLTANLPSFRLVDGKTSQNISKDQAIGLEASGDFSGKTLEIDSARSYLKGPAFAHLLGYVSEITAPEMEKDASYLLGDQIGRGGVEEAYESVLRGHVGKQLVEVDAVGKKLRVMSTLPPIPGENITLTVDAGLQRAAFSAMGGKKGAVIASNPNTGEILALISSPSFDPGDVKSSLNDPSQPLFDRAIGGTFPPGSTFKLVTATAGLETGAITAKTLIEDTGVLVIGPYKFPNWKWLRGGGVEGILDVVGAIQKSNDIFFYQVGERVGIDNLVAWAKKFGLGNRLGIDLPGEAPGLIKNDREWYLGDTYHTAIGQGDLLVTPLQMNNWTSVIANGGRLCVPHVLGAVNCKDLGIKKGTIDLIQKGMTAACSPGGTGYPLFGFKPQVACKTGTAEYGPSTGSGYKTHAWFTVFAPAEKPEIVLTVLVEGGGEGSDVAAPIARKILEKWFEK